MLQMHFKDDTRIGRCIDIDGHEWQVVDVWVDIGQGDDAPLTVTLDRVDGDDLGMHIPALTFDAVYVRQALATKDGQTFWLLETVDGHIW